MKAPAGASKSTLSAALRTPAPYDPRLPPHLDLFGSFRIGTAFGIAIRVHWLFAAMVLFLLVFGTSGGLQALEVLGLISVLFGVVVLHELGHSLVAQHFGIRVLDITLWPLGGMARMSEIPENSRIEGLIAVAGPAVNFALAAIAAPFFFGTGLVAMSAESASNAGVLAHLLLGFIFINLMLGGFNLIPAFPMDGGRLLRAWFGRNGDWLRATERAVRVGRFFAILMVVAGIWNPITGGSNFMLSLVGLFVWFAGTRELLSVRLRHARSAFAGLEGTPLGEILRGFGPPRAGGPFKHDGGPFTSPFGNGRPAEATESATTHSTGTPAAPEAQRPPGWEDGPWTEERIRELERFRGRLRGGG